jgi:hypothetical protein
LAAALCALAAVPVPALAKHKTKPKPKPAYADGLYTGTLTGTAALLGSDKIHFLVSRRTLSALTLDVAEKCGPINLTAVTDAPRGFKLAIAPNGSFSYDRTVLGDHLAIKGRLRGNQAAGTLFDSLTSGTLVCTMGRAASFTAKR